MLAPISRYDAWRTREPEDLSPIIEGVDEELARGDHDADLQAELEAAGATGVEELCDAVAAIHCRARAFLRDAMLETPIGKQFRQRLIADAMRSEQDGAW